MRYHLLACDYDGTIAHHGLVNEDTLAAMERLRATGRRLVLVTGRELNELLAIFPPVELFDRVVAENGALIYNPASKEVKLLAEAPPERFVEELRRRGVAPMSVGHAIVATWRPHETAALEVIRDQGLELQVIFNKDAVMVLPSGVNKASGLSAALKEMHFSPHEVVGVGDAENDHAFLSLCECSAAVANALPALKERADLVTPADHGEGVAQLIARIIEDDLASLEPRLARHHLVVGKDDGGENVSLPPYGISLLIAGPSGSGKSTAATSFLECLEERGYQYCIIDPEGDYDGMESALTIGGAESAPTVDEVLRVLEDAARNVVVNLIGLPLADRPPFFVNLLPRLLEMRSRSGRPHWLIVDEAHHLMPTSWEPGPQVLPNELKQVAFITVHPDQVAAAALRTVDRVIAVGHSPQETIGGFCKVVESRPCGIPAVEEGKVVLWSRSTNEAVRVQLTPSRTERRRHVRKYAEGELPPDRSFYFRGPKGALNLRAQNLILFMQVAEGVDDDTWLFHLRKGDYSQWFRERIKDEELADEAAGVEAKGNELSPAESRERVKEAITKRYTLPSSAPLPMPGTDAEPKRQ